MRRCTPEEGQRLAWAVVVRALPWGREELNQPEPQPHTPTADTQGLAEAEAQEIMFTPRLCTPLPKEACLTTGSNKPSRVSVVHTCQPPTSDRIL